MPFIQTVIINGHRLEVHHSIAQTAEKDLLKIDFKEYQTNKINKKEYIFKGKHYDFVKSKNIGEVKYALLWEDKKEDNLLSILNSIFKNPLQKKLCFMAFVFICLGILPLLVLVNFRLFIDFKFSYLHQIQEGYTKRNFQPPKF